MLSPITRAVLEETLRAKKRRRNDLHLLLPEHENAVDRARSELVELAGDIVAVTDDLERDDQARADAGMDVPASPAVRALAIELASTLGA